MGPCVKGRLRGGCGGDPRICGQPGIRLRVQFNDWWCQDGLHLRWSWPLLRPFPFRLCHVIITEESAEDRGESVRQQENAREKLECLYQGNEGDNEYMLYDVKEVVAV